MSTVGELVDQTLNEILLGTYRTKTNVLNSTIDPSANDVITKYDTMGIGIGSFLEIDEELLYVVNAPTTNRAISVVRGQRGTIPRSHAVGTTIGINPRFPRFVVKDCIREEIQSWPQEIYRATAHTVSSGGDSFDLYTDLTPPLNPNEEEIYDVLRLWRQDTNGRRIRVYGFRAEIEIEGEKTGSVFLHRQYGSSTTFQVIISRGFDVSEFDYDTDLVDEVGLKRSFEEVLKWGAAWRLIAGRETRRLLTESEGEGRKAEEVPAQANITTARIYKQWRYMALTTEIMKLRQRNGIRTRT